MLPRRTLRQTAAPSWRCAEILVPGSCMSFLTLLDFLPPTRTTPKRLPRVLNL